APKSLNTNQSLQHFASIRTSLNCSFCRAKTWKMSVQVLNIKLQRSDAGVSWGFVIQGGKEFHSPFVIQKVHPNSLADQASVKPGDYILRIGSHMVENYMHSQAREAITAQGNHLELTIQRGAAPRSEDYAFNFAFPQHRLMNQDNNFNRVPSSSPQVGIQMNNNKALLTQSYNSPMGLYSNQNIAETLRPRLDENWNEIKKSPEPPISRRMSWTPRKHELTKQIAKLGDPNCPSLTQSKSFKLLQEALESGDKEKDLVYFDKITKKTEVRRVSLDANLATRPTRRLSKVNLIDQESIEENTDQNEARINRSQSVSRDILCHSSFLTSLKPSNSKNFSQRRHSYIPSSPTTQYKPYQQPSKAMSPVKPYQSNNYQQPSFKPNSHGMPGAVNRGHKGSAIFNNHNHGPNQPQCASCFQIIRGPFISAVGKIWCPNHFICANQSCCMSLIDVGFVEENGKLYCEKDYADFLAPKCHKCHNTILAECCSALDKTYHPECFCCANKQKIGSGSFHIEDGMVYCERDFSALFSVKCSGCQFPIEAGDKFLEAINEKWHVECFICSKCNVPLSGGFAVKGGKPY
ncbi:LIM domain-binding 3-like isoform X1, partial [Brachionus plicatilis]